LAIVASLSGIIAARVDLLLLTCAVLGFLVFNLRHRWRPRALVYMGDAGSMMLGGAIAYFAVVLSTGAEKSAPLPILLWLFALPLFDMLILMVRRAAAGDNPLRGDRRHLHHFLLRSGIPPQLATAILIAACTVLGGAGLIGWHLGVSGPVMLLGLAVPFMVHAYVVFHGWKMIQRLRGVQAGGAAAAETASLQGAD
jgi:UDP-GlcNAc:undecaprenyl-phosphate GlcNAc-1-phosphate transferase